MFRNLVVAESSLVTLTPAKLKKAMEKIVPQKASASSGLCASWYTPSYASSSTILNTQSNPQMEITKQCWVSVIFWCGSGSLDSYLWPMDPDSDPTKDPTLFFIDFMDEKNIFFFFLFFSFNFVQAHHLQSKKYHFLLKFCVKFILQAFIISTHVWEKGSIRSRIRISTSE